MGHTAELARNGQEALEKIVVNAAALFSALEAEVFFPNRRRSPVMRGKTAPVRRKVRQRSEKTFSHTVDSRNKPAASGQDARFGIGRKAGKTAVRSIVDR